MTEAGENEVGAHEATLSRQARREKRIAFWCFDVFVVIGPWLFTLVALTSLATIVWLVHTGDLALLLPAIQMFVGAMFAALVTTKLRHFQQHHRVAVQARIDALTREDALEPAGDETDEGGGSGPNASEA